MRKLLVTLVLAALCGPALAKVDSLEGASLGEWWYGPKYTLDDLKGRVVLVEMWGYN